MFSEVRRLIACAIAADEGARPAREVLDEAAQLAQRRSGRRRALAGLGAASAVAAAPRIAAAQRLTPPEPGAVAIVGAGLAGLACADSMVATGVVPAVYEAGGRVGGRCHSLRGFFPGQVAELGGELIDTTHTTMRGYANRFGLALENVSAVPGETFFHFGGQRYTEAQVVDEFRAFVPAMRADLNRLSNGPTALSNNEYDRQLDRLSLRDYLATRGAGPLIRAVLDVAYTIEYGRETDRQSCLGFLFFVHADRRSKFTPFGVFSDERFHVASGNDAIASGLAAAIGTPIAFGHRLLRVRRLADGRVQLAFDTGGGRVVERSHAAVVLTLPFSVLRQVELDASLGLPEAKRHAIAAFDYGTNSKNMIGFRGRPWYERYACSGETYSDLPNLQASWETNPSAARFGERGILTDYSGGDRGERLDPRRPGVEAAAFLTDLDRVMPGISVTATRDASGKLLAALENWSRNPLALGSYTSNAPGYFTTIEGHAGTPVGNLFFGGEHTDSFYSWQGFMEGACLSGLRAAAEVADLLRGR